MKKKLLYLIPLFGIGLSSCGGNGSTTQPGSSSGTTTGSTTTATTTSAETNPELEKFNELVDSIKTDHNYSLHVHSQFVDEEDENEILDATYFNINDDAFYSDYSYYTYSGLIKQEDQGYVYFDQIVNVISPEYFYFTNSELGISKLYDLIGENLFYDNDYVQDSSDKTLFTTQGQNNRAVAANFTQYAAYIKTSQMSVASSMSCIVDVDNATLTLTLNYSIWYYDEGEHNEPGYITLQFKNIGTTVNAAVEDYVEEPTVKYTAPTEWDSDATSLFNKWFNKVTPSFPSGASYAFSIEEKLYEGFYYAGVTDLNCGDLTASYGAQLVLDGYSEVESGIYTKLMHDSTAGFSYTYKVMMKYSEPTLGNPNGVFYIYYRCNTSAATFNSIEAYNAYMTKMGYDELVPNLPEEETCTSISNFKDQTASSSDYACAINKTNFFKISIPTYSKAQAFYNSYVELLEAKGYTDKSVGLYTTYSFDNGGGVAHGTYVGFENFPSSSSSYTGIIYMRIIISALDADELRTRGSVLDSISLKNYTTEYEINSSFSFDGVCTATYANGASKKVTPTSVSTPDMSKEGTQTITVSYTENTVTKTATYDINIVDTKQLVSLTLGGYCDRQFVKNGTFNHLGLSVTANFSDGSTKNISSDSSVVYGGYDLSHTGVQTVTVAYEYKDVTKTTSYDIKVSDSLTWPSLSLEDDTDLSYWFTQEEDGEEITTHNYNTSPSFYLVVASTAGATIEGISVVDDEDAKIELITDDYYGCGYSEYLVTPTFSFDTTSIVIDVETGTAPVTDKYTVNKATGLSNGSVVLVSHADGAEVEVGETVKFKATPSDGYEVASTFIVDHPEVTITTETNPLSQQVTYKFTMPAYNVTVSASFQEKSYTVSKASVTGLKIVLVTGTSATAGSIVRFTATAEEGYTLESVFIKDHTDITITKTVNPMSGATSYSFTMPAYNVTISGTVSGGSVTNPLNKVLADHGTFAGTFSEDNTKFCNLDFAEDGTATQTCGNGLSQSVYSFNYELTLKEGTTYTVSITNITKKSGMNQQVAISYMTKFEVTFAADLKTVTSINLVLYNTTYSATYTFVLN